MSLTKEELRLDLIEQSRIFHFGSVSMTEEPARSATLAAARYAREKGLLVSYDPNLRRNLWCDEQTAAKYIKEGLTLCDVAKLSDEECRFLYGDQDIPSQGRQMMRDYPSLRLLFVTCGGAGSYVFCGDQMQYAPGYSVKVADTTGAGDTFMGRRALSASAARRRRLVLRGAAVAPSLRQRRQRALRAALRRHSRHPRQGRRGSVSGGTPRSRRLGPDASYPGIKRSLIPKKVLNRNGGLL